MKTWVRRSLDVGALTAGALLVTGAAAQAGPTLDSTGNIGALTGNQLDIPVQVPVDICGNAVAVAGAAMAGCEGGASALNPEWRFDGTEMNSSGNLGLLVGNQLSAPVQVPVDICGNAVAVIGSATAACDGGAQAGPDRRKPGYHKHPNHDYDKGGKDYDKGGKKKHQKHDKQYDYEHTHVSEAATESGPDLDSTGNVGLLTGNQVHLPVQIPISICGNAIAVLGSATAGCEGGAVAH